MLHKFKSRGTATSVARVACGAAATILLSIAGTSTAAASPITAATTATPSDSKGSLRNVGTGRHCASVVKKLKPGQTDSEVLSTTCSDSRTQARSAVAQASVLLVTFYQNTSYNIDPNTHQVDPSLNTYDIYGAEGPCDVLGYGFSNIVNINVFQVQGISSYTTDHDCSGQRIWNQMYYTDLGGGGGRFFSGFSVDYVGNQYNDAIASMKVYKYY